MREIARALDSPLKKYMRDKSVSPIVLFLPHLPPWGQKETPPPPPSIRSLYPVSPANFKEENSLRCA